MQTFRRRTSYASMTTVPAEFAAPHIVCFPNNRSCGIREAASMRTGPSNFFGPHIACFPGNKNCGVCGAATPLCPCEQALRTFWGRALHASPTEALRCLRGCNSIASLPTGPPNLSGRASHASLAAGPAVFAGQHLYDTCVRAAEMRLGCENALSIQIGVWAANWQSQLIGVWAANGQRIGVLAANWRLGCKFAANWHLGCKNILVALSWRSGCKLAFGLQIGVGAAKWRFDCKLVFWLQYFAAEMPFCSQNAKKY